MKRFKKLITVALVAVSLMAVAPPALAAYTPQSNAFSVGAGQATNTGPIQARYGQTVAWSAGISVTNSQQTYSVGSNINGGSISWRHYTGPGNYGRTVNTGAGGYTQLHVDNSSNASIRISYSAT